MGHVSKDRQKPRAAACRGQEERDLGRRACGRAGSSQPQTCGVWHAQGRDWKCGTGVDEKGLGVRKTDATGDCVEGRQSRARSWRPAGSREEPGARRPCPALPGQGRLQLLLLLGQLHLELGDLRLQVGDLLVEVAGLALQLPFQLLQLLPALLLLLQPHYDKARARQEAEATGKTPGGRALGYLTISLSRGRMVSPEEKPPCLGIGADQGRLGSQARVYRSSLEISSRNSLSDFLSFKISVQSLFGWPVYLPVLKS